MTAEQGFRTVDLGRCNWPQPPKVREMEPASTQSKSMTLLGVWAHPDDEAYLSAALMNRVVNSGGRVVLVTATRGELGGDTDDRQAFAAMRERELRNALAILGVTDVR